MTNPSSVGVIGCGAFGTALANVFADAGASVTLWARDNNTISQILMEHKNDKYLKDVPLNRTVSANSDLGQVLELSSVIVCAIPTQQIRNVFLPHAKKLAGKTILNSAKGIEIGTNYRVSQIFSDICREARYAILSGPSFALELAKRLPTAVTIASMQPELAQSIQKSMGTPYFRAYTSNDVIGVELAGALKNVVAVASGIVTGLKLGYNTQAALINRGAAEILRMGKHLGANPLTFMGLAGVGDLILTCTGPLSRNRKLGELLGQGNTLEEARAALGGVAEGAYTAKSAYELAKSKGIEMPITDQVYRILYEERTPGEALQSLMGRDLKEEW